MKKFLSAIMFLWLFSFLSIASAYNGPPVVESLPYLINGHTYTEVIGTCQANGTCTVTYFENLSSGAAVYFYGLYGTLWVTQSTNYNYLSRYCNPGDSSSCSDNSGTDSYMSFAGAYPWDSSHIQTTRDIWNVPHTSVYFSANLQPALGLTVNLDPQSGGGMASLPDGENPDCGSAGNICCGMAGYTDVCQVYYPTDSDVTLKAFPNTGWTFAYFDNGTTQLYDNPSTVTMSSAKLVTTVFKFNLAFPLQIDCSGISCTPYTAPVSTVFDHSATGEYGSDTDHHVTTFSGEVSDNQSPYSGSTCYPKTDNSAFGSGFNYVGTSGTGGVYYLCYDGHPGTDYPVANNTPVYAAADGIAHIPSSFPGVSSAQTYNTVEIDHQNGYKTYYLHLSNQNVTEDQQVYKGQTIIGYSGNTGTSGYHLHFEVQKETPNGWVPVDPYGWTGSGTDPYTRATNITLWE